MTTLILYQGKWPTDGTWYVVDRVNGLDELRLEHVRKGQELRYEMADNHSDWMITDVSGDGRFQAVPIPPEEGEGEGSYSFQLLIEE